MVVWLIARLASFVTFIACLVWNHSESDMEDSIFAFLVSLLKVAKCNYKGFFSGVDCKEAFDELFGSLKSCLRTSKHTMIFNHLLTG